MKEVGRVSVSVSGKGCHQRLPEDFVKSNRIDPVDVSQNLPLLSVLVVLAPRPFHVGCTV